MGLADMLLNAHGGDATTLLAQRFGISPEQAASAVTALAPALATGLQQNATSEGGLGSLLGALLGGQHQQYVDNVETLDRPDTVADGNAILGHVLGSKDASRQVATQAAAQTGLSAGLLKQMLPVVAAMTMGVLSKHTTSQPGTETSAPSGGGMLGTLGSLLGGGQGQGASGGALLNVLGRLLG
jgi:hypothetical protein